MNKRVEILKKIAKYNKDKKIPKRFTVAELTVLLLFMYLIQSFGKFVKSMLEYIFPSTRKVLIYITLGMVLGVFVLPHSHMKLDDERAYGDVTELTGEVNSEETTINKSEQEENNVNSGNTVNAGNTANSDEPNIYDVTEHMTEAENKVYTEEELQNMSFYIKVNRLMNCITIYTADENGEYTIPVKAMICSTGGEETPLGVYNTKQKYIFRRLLYDVYGQYATRIEGQILFHSVSYANGYKDTLIAEEFNKLGSSASHGCIRLTTEDAKWIYDYCGIGTTVDIYEDDNPGPLGKPEMINIPEDTVWDPTDIDPANPWNENTSVILAEDREIELGTSVDLLDGVTAIDTCGNIITDKVKINGNADSDVEGVYNIEYTVTDLIGRSAFKTVRIVVKGKH